MLGFTCGASPFLQTVPIPIPDNASFTAVELNGNGNNENNRTSKTQSIIDNANSTGCLDGVLFCDLVRGQR